MGRVSELQLKEAIANFNYFGRLKACEPFGSGHINDTYRLTFEIGDMGDVCVIPQRMNREIFKKPVELMENIGSDRTEDVDEGKLFPKWMVDGLDARVLARPRKRCR